MTNRSSQLTEINLKRGIKAVRAGQVGPARQQLAAVLQREPNNVPALFWLAFVAPGPAESVRLLERALALEPDNERARAGLTWARRRLAAEQESASKAAEPAPAPAPARQAPVSAGPELPDTFIRHQLQPKERPQPAARQPEQPASRWVEFRPLLLVLAAAGLVGILLMGALWYLPPAWLPGLEGGEGAGVSLPADMAGGPAAVPVSRIDTPTPMGLGYASAGDVVTLPEAALDDAPGSLPPLSIRPAMPPGLTEASQLLRSTSAAEAVEREPVTFIGPAEAFLDGPRLFEPVDEASLAHQPASPDEKWIEVDLGEQRVIAWEGNVPVMSFLSSTGLPNTPTVVGTYNIYWKLESTLMTGPGYYLPEVPYTMYFYGGYALHGTYWHDNFGQPMSHGCVNLQSDNAKELFEWADPIIPTGQRQVVASADNPGTLVVVHQ